MRRAVLAALLLLAARPAAADEWERRTDYTTGQPVPGYRLKSREGLVDLELNCAQSRLWLVSPLPLRRNASFPTTAISPGDVAIRTVRVVRLPRGTVNEAARVVLWTHDPAGNPGVVFLALGEAAALLQGITTVILTVPLVPGAALPTSVRATDLITATFDVAPLPTC